MIFRVSGHIQVYGVFIAKGLRVDLCNTIGLMYLCVKRYRPDECRIDPNLTNSEASYHIKMTQSRLVTSSHLPYIPPPNFYEVWCSLANRCACSICRTAFNLKTEKLHLQCGAHWFGWCKANSTGGIQTYRFNIIQRSFSSIYKSSCIVTGAIAQHIAYYLAFLYFILASISSTSNEAIIFYLSHKFISRVIWWLW